MSSVVEAVVSPQQQQQARKRFFLVGAVLVGMLFIVVLSSSMQTSVLPKQPSSKTELALNESMMANLVESVEQQRARPPKTSVAAASAATAAAPDLSSPVSPTSFISSSSSTKQRPPARKLHHPEEGAIQKQPPPPELHALPPAEEEEEGHAQTGGGGVAETQIASSGLYTMDDIRRERELRQIVSDKTSAFVTVDFNASLGLAKIRGGTELHLKMAECAAKSYAEGLMWCYRKNECVPILGFKTPLQPGEVSEQELTCTADSVYESLRPPHLPRWVNFGFHNFHDRFGVLDRFGISTAGIERAAADAQQQAEREQNVEEILKQQKQQETAAAAAAAVNNSSSSSPTTSSSPSAVAPDTEKGMIRSKRGRPLTSAPPSVGEERAGAWAPPPPPPPPLSPERIRAQLHVSLRREYSRFFFFTSSFMRQWLPWEPRPRIPARWPTKYLDTMRAKPPEAWRMRAYHDPHIQEHYVLEYFCVGAFGLSGFAPNLAPYVGRDDGRDRYHGEAEWRQFFTRVTRLDEVPQTFDERPVVFFPSMKLSRHNQAHLSLKFFALLGMLEAPVLEDSASQKGNRRETWRKESSAEQSAKKKSDGNFSTLEEFSHDSERAGGGAGGRAGQPPFADSEFVPGSGTDHWNPHSGLKPLVVIVSDRDDKTDKHKTSAIAFYLRVLDLPYAIVYSGNPGEEYLRAMFALTKHGGAAPETLMRRRKDSAADGGDGGENISSASSADPVALLEENDDVPSSVVASKSNASNSSSIRPVQQRRRYLPIGAFSFSDQRTRVCFRRGVAWSNCVHCDADNIMSEMKTETSFGFWTPLRPSRRYILDRMVTLTANCVRVPGRRGGHEMMGKMMNDYPPPQQQQQQQENSVRISNSNVSSPARKLSSAAAVVVPPLISTTLMIARARSVYELPNLFVLIRSTSRKMTNMPFILAQIISELKRKGFVNEVFVREPWRGSRQAYINDIRRSSIFLYYHGGAAGELYLAPPRSVFIEVNAAFEGCDATKGPHGAVGKQEALGSACWFGPTLSDYLAGSHWILQVDQQRDTSFMASAPFLIDLVTSAVCRWYRMSPATRKFPNARTQLFCADSEHGGLLRHSSHVFLDRNRGNFPVDLVDVQRTLRGEFGAVMSEEEARKLVQRLKGLDPKEQSSGKLVLTSDAPVFFQTLLRRFVDWSIDVTHRNPSKEHRALCVRTEVFGEDIPTPAPAAEIPHPVLDVNETTPAPTPQQRVTLPPGVPGGNVTMCLHVLRFRGGREFG